MNGSGEASGRTVDDHDVHDLVDEAAREAFEDALDGEKAEPGTEYDLDVTVEIDFRQV